MVFEDVFAIVGFSLVWIVIEVDTHNIIARLTQTGNVTMSVIAGAPISLRHS